MIWNIGQREGYRAHPMHINPKITLNHSVCNDPNLEHVVAIWQLKALNGQEEMYGQPLENRLWNAKLD